MQVFPPLENISTHSSSTVLEIIIQTCQVKGTRFTNDIWEELLLILLGVTDSLLRWGKENLDKHGANLGHKLSPILLRVLFEVWLRSETMNSLLWKRLYELFEGWRHKHAVILQWNATVIALTNRVIRILYGKEEGTDVVSVSL